MRPVSMGILLAALLCGSAAGQEVSGNLEMTFAADGALTASATIANARAVNPAGLLAPFDTVAADVGPSRGPGGRGVGGTPIQANDPGLLTFVLTLTSLVLG